MTKRQRLSFCRVKMTSHPAAVGKTLKISKKRAKLVEARKRRRRAEKKRQR